MRCQLAKLMLHHRRRRPDLLKDFLAVLYLSLLTCSIFLNLARMVLLDIYMDLHVKNLDAEYGSKIADAEGG